MKPTTQSTTRTMPADPAMTLSRSLPPRTRWLLVLVEVQPFILEWLPAAAGPVPGHVTYPFPFVRSTLERTVLSTTAAPVLAPSTRVRPPSPMLLVSTAPSKPLTRPVDVPRDEGPHTRLPSMTTGQRHDQGSSRRVPRRLVTGSHCNGRAPWIRHTSGFVGDATDMVDRRVTSDRSCASPSLSRPPLEHGPWLWPATSTAGPPTSACSARTAAASGRSPSTSRRAGRTPTGSGSTAIVGRTAGEPMRTLPNEFGGDDSILDLTDGSHRLTALQSAEPAEP